MAYSINDKKSMKDGKLDNTEVSVQHKTVPKYFLHCLSLPEGFCRDLNDVTLAVEMLVSMMILTLRTTIPMTYLIFRELRRFD